MRPVDTKIVSSYHGLRSSRLPERVRWAFSNRVIASPITVERVGIFLYRGEFLRVGEQILRVHTTDVQRGLIYVY
jgi:hypothetical protein